MSDIWLAALVLIPLAVMFVGGLAISSSGISDCDVKGQRKVATIDHDSLASGRAEEEALAARIEAAWIDFLDSEVPKHAD